MSHTEDLEKMEQLSGGPEQEASGVPSPQEAEQTGTIQDRAQRPEGDHPQVEEPENLR